MLPSCNPVTGSLWLEKGGLFALANIRGGGSSPAGHEAIQPAFGGCSWEAEYGDPDDPDMWSYIKQLYRALLISG
jgi:prolyl oligopeptidase PreP (S9A serine peptidase family)